MHVSLCINIFFWIWEFGNYFELLEGKFFWAQKNDTALLCFLKDPLKTHPFHPPQRHPQEHLQVAMADAAQAESEKVPVERWVFGDVEF